jgi:hypothetical protein
VEKTDITFFDPKADWTVVERGLPHWSQAGYRLLYHLAAE